MYQRIGRYGTGTTNTHPYMHTQTTLEMLSVLGASEMRIASVADQLTSPPSDCLTDVEMDLTASPLEMAGDLPITFAVRDDLFWTGPFLDVCSFPFSIYLCQNTARFFLEI